MNAEEFKMPLRKVVCCSVPLDILLGMHISEPSKRYSIDRFG